jgi:Ca2+-binding RTX toxin-like protein
MALPANRAISVTTVTGSVGVNTHLDFNRYGYQSLTTTEAAINYLGVKNLRDSADNPNTVGPNGTWQQIANATGAKFDDYMTEGSPASDIADLGYARQLGAQGILNFIEGGNENDNAYAVGQGNSLAWTASFQQQVYAAGHAMGLPVINMSFGAGWTWTNNWHGDYDKVGDLSSYADYANAHTYSNVDQLPDATIQRLNGDALLAASSRPVITTEIGWNNSTFSQADAARFTLDAVFDGIEDGDVKTYFYALFDDGSGQFGLMNQDGSAKPAGTALHNLTTIMADSGGARTDSLTYGLTGTTGNDHSLLMEKSDGTFQLAIWNETDAAHYVTLSLGAAAQAIRIYDPLTSASAVTTYANTSTITVNVPNHPVIVEILPSVITMSSGDTVSASISYVLTAGVANLTLTGSADISGTGNDLANNIQGNGGNNFLDGGAGADIMTGGLGGDTYVVDNAGDQVVENANEGNDAVYAGISYALSANVENLYLTGSADISASGNALANYIVGNSGNNLIDGGAGADIMLGGAGSDVYIVDNAGDQVIENANDGFDAVFASISYVLPTNVEYLALNGSANLDATGNALANYLIGNSGNNTLDGGAGADIMIGGAGNDTYFVDNAGDQIVENANEGTDTVYAGVGYALSANVENLTLTGSADLGATGNDLANNIQGNSGNNFLDGGAGADIMTGGLGGDTYFVDNAGDQVVENANEGNDAVYAAISYVLPTNVENLYLTGGANLNATGNALANYMVGNSGNNVMVGGGGADYLDGGSGVNTADYSASLSAVQVNLAAHAGLSGDAQGDVLVNIQNVVGSSFGDNLTGDAGNNILTGNGGADAYAFGRGGGQDTIVNGLSGNSGATGALDFASGIATNQLWLLRSGNDLQIDVMGSTDHVTVSGWYASATADLSQLTTAGGLKLDSQLQQLVQSMANYGAANSAFDPTMVAQAPSNDPALTNVIAASWHT